MSKLMGRLPQHNLYVELFSGNKSELFNRWPSTSELYNDYNGDVKDLFDILRHDGEALTRFIFSDEEKEDGYKRERWDRMRQMVTNFRNGNIRGDIRTVTGFRDMSRDLKEELRSWDEQMERIIKRLRLVQFEGRRFDDLIERFDFKGTVFYVDVTVLPDDVEHGELVEHLLTLKGRCIVYGAKERVYERLIDEGWQKVSEYGDQDTWINYRVA